MSPDIQAHDNLKSNTMKNTITNILFFDILFVAIISSKLVYVFRSIERAIVISLSKSL